MDFDKTDTLADYFEALDKRLENIMPAKFSLLADIAGYKVRLFFPDYDCACNVVPDMFVRPDNSAPADATFIWCVDRIFPYQLHKFLHLDKFNHVKNPDSSGYDIFQAEDSCGYVEIVGNTVRAGDYKKNKYYVITGPSLYSKWPISAHPFANIIFLWAQRCNLLLLHAASVGIDGHGVLIVGHGGTGKSTLTCTCLLDDYDFVSDDYCLLSASGSRTVCPVYTNVFLNSDSLEKLPMFKPFEILPMQGEKGSFSVGENRIKRVLPVEAIILPQITDNIVPKIESDVSNKALAQLVYSTIKQTGRFQETEFVRKLAHRLLGMPAYRFSLTQDLHKNCQYLKKWIREELPCTN